MKRLILFLIFASIAYSCKENNKEVKVNEADFIKLADSLENQMRTLTIPLYEAYFDASINSNDSMWKQVSDLESKYNSFVSQPEVYKKLKVFKDANIVSDPIQKRRLDVIYNEFLSKQADIKLLDEISKLTSEIEGKYSKFRAEYNNKKYSDNDVEDILKKSHNQDELKGVWEAHKQIGPLVKDDIIKIVKKRNELAKKLGFSNYHEMSLKLSFQDPKEIESIFDELDKLTKDEFAKIKNEIDSKLATMNKIKIEDLKPWHYQNRYFQEAPHIWDVDFDKYYKGKDIVKLAENYYKSLNLPIDRMVANSDLFEKPNKNQHAYCTNIDRTTKDIRVLCNIKDNSSWMETMLHEFGHALYEDHYEENLPWALKVPAHIFTTEAIAMMFGRFALKPEWIQANLGISDAEKTKISDVAFKMLKTQQLVFSRWAQVMYRFEKSMYADPDQDLNKLWWDLVEKYQLVKKPEGRNMPDWATKIHIATSPCYYHNYLLGELLASQLYHYITTNVIDANSANLNSFYNEPKVGEYLKKNVFGPGAKYEWNDMIEKATGEKLTPKHYANQFIHN
ncbi:MAG TPA: M3 family metallopeptidase [Candidatus Kapabacteria bacterium]|nr:M3 family metallopeptidase [Candidatus Kapabacteria bacterium]